MNAGYFSSQPSILCIAFRFAIPSVLDVAFVTTYSVLHFVDVVSAQYEETEIPELALLKQKLLKYREENVFAQNIDEINAVRNAILANNLTYIDLADTTDELQKELIEFIHEELDKVDAYSYCFVKLTNKNSDKKLLRTLLDNNHVFTTIICSHSYKYVHELKQKAENIIFFAPQTIQHDFASYNTFLSKLNQNEFVVYGALTQNIPFLVELSELSQDEINKETKTEEVVVATVPETPVEETLLPTTETIENSIENTNFDSEIDNIFENNFFESNQIESTENLLADSNDFVEETTANDDFASELELVQNEDLRSNDELIEEIAKDVDKIYYEPKSNDIPQAEDFENYSEETLTENDLDFIGEMPFDTPVEESTNTDDLSLEVENISIEEEEPQIENLLESNDEELGFAPDLTEEPNKTEQLPTLDEVMQDANEQEDLPILEDDAINEDYSEDELPAYEEDQTEELPIYETEEVTEPAIQFAQGDTVTHPKYGTGVVEKLIKYGNKTLCSISFEEVGRRLLDPSISELQKVI